MSIPVISRTPTLSAPLSSSGKKSSELELTDRYFKLLDQLRDFNESAFRYLDGDRSHEECTKDAIDLLLDQSKEISKPLKERSLNALEEYTLQGELTHFVGKVLRLKNWRHLLILETQIQEQVYGRPYKALFPLYALAKNTLEKLGKKMAVSNAVLVERYAGLVHVVKTVKTTPFEDDLKLVLEVASTTTSQIKRSQQVKSVATEIGELASRCEKLKGASMACFYLKFREQAMTCYISNSQRQTSFRGRAKTISQYNASFLDEVASFLVRTYLSR